MVVPATVVAADQVDQVVVEHPLHLLALAEQVYNLRKIQVCLD